MASESAHSKEETQSTPTQSLSEPSSANEEPVALYRKKTELDEEGNPSHRTISRVATAAEAYYLARVLSGQNKRDMSNIPNMGRGKPYPPDLVDHEAYRVDFENDEDPHCPLNWSLKEKLPMSFAVAFATMNSSFGSSIYGSTLPVVEKVFHVGVSVAELGICLYVLGFASGPIVWGPISEYFGRKVPMILSCFLMICFAFASATAKDFQTLMLARFFAGAAGAGPLTVVPAMYADMYDSRTRGTASALFTLCVTGGPMLGPVIGEFVVSSYLGWRWCLYISGIMGALSGVIVLFTCKETYHPIVLVEKARLLRGLTDNWGIYAEHETVVIDFKQIVHNSLLRPFKMLASEPILMLISFYGGLVYGLLYMCLSVIPRMYQEQYHWHGGVIGLPYLSFLIGCILATCCEIFIFGPRYLKALAKSGLPVVPEERLQLMMIGGPVFTIGIFWIFWTGAYPKTPETPHGCHFMVPVVGGSLFGFGFIGIFIPMISYVIDSYLMLAASGMAANTLLRSAMGAAFPLFTVQMYNNLGYQWAGTLVGCLSAILIPVPFIFYKFGGKIRQKSKFAVDLSAGIENAEANEKQDEERGHEAEEIGREEQVEREAASRARSHGN